MISPNKEKPAQPKYGGGFQEVFGETNIKTNCFDNIHSSQFALNVQAAHFLKRRFDMPLPTAKAIAALAGLGGDFDQ